MRKGDFISGIDPESREETVLFDPRQDALNEQVRRGALTNDPLRHYLEAMSVALGAMHKMFVDGTLTIAEAVAEAKPQPVDNDTLRTAIILGIKTHAGGILRTIKLATYIAGATLLFGTFAAGYGIHWWMTPAVSYAGIRRPRHLRIAS